jgi:uncharacterized protein with HEPN domain
MRRDELYLRDILEAADRIAEFLASRADFDSDLVRSAVAQKLTIIGEAAARVSVDLRARRPEVPWAKVVAFRNILVHEYFGIDWDVVRRAAEREVPLLREQIAATLADEFRPE